MDYIQMKNPNWLLLGHAVERAQTQTRSTL